ncbi:MAG: efflux RND transporter permease subunit [Planctomycetota bacterium]|jgi:predicted RND superfamily exporter protein
MKLTRPLTFSVRHPWIAAAILVAVTAALGSQIPKLRRDVRVDKIFPETDPSFAVYERFRDTFGADNRIAFCAVALDGDVLEAEQLARVHLWTEELRQEPVVDGAKVTSLTHAFLVRVRGEDGLDIAPFYSPADHDDWNRGEADRLLREHPGFHQRLVSSDRTLAVLYVPILPELDNEKGRRRFIDRLREFFDQRLRAGERAYLDGFVISEIELHTLVGQDSARFYGLSFLVLVLMLGMTFRRVSLVGAATADVLLSVVWTLGFMALCDIPMSFLSAAIPVMIIVACVGDSVYLTTRYAQLLADGLAKREALLGAVEEAGMACLLTSLTTAVGFLSLLTSEAEIIRELGLPVGVGVLASYVVSFLLLPPLLDHLPVPKEDCAAGQAAARARCAPCSSGRGRRSGRGAATLGHLEAAGGLRRGRAAHGDAHLLGAADGGGGAARAAGRVRHSRSPSRAGRAGGPVGAHKAAAKRGVPRAWRSLRVVASRLDRLHAPCLAGAASGHAQASRRGWGPGRPAPRL